MVAWMSNARRSDDDDDYYGGTANSNTIFLTADAFYYYGNYDGPYEVQVELPLWVSRCFSRSWLVDHVTLAREEFEHLSSVLISRIFNVCAGVTFRRALRCNRKGVGLRIKRDR